MSDDQYLGARRPAPGHRRVREARLTVTVVAATVLTLAGVAVAGAVRESGGASVRAEGGVAPAAAAVAAPAVAIAAPDTTPTGEEIAVADGATPVAPVANAVAATDEPAGCKLTTRSMEIGKSGPEVECLQRALADAGFYSGAVTGQYDNATSSAVRSLQETRKLFVDGVAGRETGLSLGIWPDEESLVVRTPPPPDGATDTTGFVLSPVAVSGADPAVPALPPDSGSGRRVVYDRAGQRAWAIDDNDQIIRSWLVSGSMYNNETPGTWEVFSRSDQSTAWNGKAILPMMIRWKKTDIGNLGFHGIPRHVEDNSPYQTTDELGTRLSGGCQRQHNIDAEFMWQFAVEGTTVVVT